VEVQEGEGQKEYQYLQPGKTLTICSSMATPSQAAEVASASAAGSVEGLQQQVEGVGAAISRVERELEEVKAVLRKKVQGTLGREEDPYSMTIDELKGHLRSLMRKEEQLRDEKAILMQRQVSAGE
jgi:exonuclease VII large subunit